VLDERGLPGPASRWLGVGAFARVHLDRPPGPVLYANRLGGFQVRCPTTDQPIVAAFQQAMTAWRGGGGRSLICPACGAPHLLDALGYRPAAAVGPWAVVAADVEAASFSEAAVADARLALGAVSVVARRT
jgi:hypothetical protein